jgi:hypothetical protein
MLYGFNQSRQFTDVAAHNGQRPSNHMVDIIRLRRQVEKRHAIADID